eukprot:GHVN01069487.1.p1 GENE.GHVN01069487.1~~GHVN01069487.1.p1  ORF type:complete len:739 (+),score=130.62 GHVN01069487.1:651-2867(+)
MRKTLTGTPSTATSSGESQMKLAKRGQQTVTDEKDNFLRETLSPPSLTWSTLASHDKLPVIRTSAPSDSYYIGEGTLSNEALTCYSVECDDSDESARQSCQRRRRGSQFAISERSFRTARSCDDSGVCDCHSARSDPEEEDLGVDALGDVNRVARGESEEPHPPQNAHLSPEDAVTPHSPNTPPMGAKRSVSFYVAEGTDRSAKEGDKSEKDHDAETTDAAKYNCEEGVDEKGNRVIYYDGSSEDESTEEESSENEDEVGEGDSKREGENAVVDEAQGEGVGKSSSDPSCSIAPDAAPVFENDALIRIEKNADLPMPSSISATQDGVEKAAPASQERAAALDFAPKAMARSKLATGDGDVVYSGDQITGVGLFHYENNECYEGEYLDGNITGRGVYLYQDGAKYDGHFIDGVFNGLGKYTFACGAVYEGNFHDGKMTGVGSYTYPDNSVYVGELVDGTRHGCGKLTAPTGEVWDGMFKSAKLNGPGHFISAEGHSYTGDFVDGKRSGKGRQKNKDGSILYDGDFLDDEMHGYGRLYYSNGAIFEGQLDRGEPNGQGKLQCTDKSQYQGLFLKGKRTGEGRYKAGNGEMMEGTFLDGVLHGRGKLSFKGGLYDGDFVHGARTGRGKMKTQYGEVYEGDFVDGKMHGKGRAKLKNGSVYEGEFKENKRTGHGKEQAPGGIVCEGEFVDGKLNGKGKQRFATGLQLEGTFLNGKPHGTVKCSSPDGKSFEAQYADGVRIEG